jgi:hypothetical protein
MTFNSEIFGRERQMNIENELTTGSSANIDGLFDEPRECKRLNRYGYTVITRHYSQASLDYQSVDNAG